MRAQSTTIQLIDNDPAAPSVVVPPYASTIDNGPAARTVVTGNPRKDRPKKQKRAPEPKVKPEPEVKPEPKVKTEPKVKIEPKVKAQPISMEIPPWKCTTCTYVHTNATERSFLTCTIFQV